MFRLSRLPATSLPIKPPRKKDIARPAFTYPEYKTILEYLEAKEKLGFTGHPNEYGRRMFYQYIRMSFSSGMRPNEMFSLRVQ